MNKMWRKFGGRVFYTDSTQPRTTIGVKRAQNRRTSLRAKGHGAELTYEKRTVIVWWKPNGWRIRPPSQVRKFSGVEFILDTSYSTDNLQFDERIKLLKANPEIRVRRARTESGTHIYTIATTTWKTERAKVLLKKGNG